MAGLSANASQPIEPTPLEEIIVTGTRVPNRAVAHSPTPVDVLLTAEFSGRAGGDMADLLSELQPSYSVRSTGDAASLVRPASLRGLPSDATLILVNGKRRHRSSVISFIGAGLFDGAQGPDISVIPVSAIKQVEVLRDGASAQYGSDAIAGVMNFLLKNNADGGSLELKTGQTYAGDGDAYQIAGNVGLPLSSRGFVSLSAEYRRVDPAVRAVQTDTATGLITAGNRAVSNPAKEWGSAEVFMDFKSFIHFGLELDNNTAWYGFANYAERQVETVFSFRNPNTRGGVFGRALNLAAAAPDSNGNDIPLLVDSNNDTVPREQIVDNTGVIRSDLAAQPWTQRYDRLVADVTPNGMDGNCPQTDTANNGGLDIRDSAGLSAVQANPNCFVFNELFPGGFTPRFGSELNDASLVTGLRGSWDGGLNWDVSAGTGRHEAEFYLRNTVNASLGPNSPTKFTTGTYIQREHSFNADLSFAIEANINQHIASGFEWREEEFQVRGGDVAAWQPGPFVNQGFSIASNGFSGFSPNVVGSWRRSNSALYGDYEAQLTSDLLLGAALRWENYDSFGSTKNYKLSAHWSLTDSLALRATHSTGFRAPTPGQANISNITTVLVDGVLVNRGTLPPTSAIATHYGGRELEPEQSSNYTLGAVLSFASFSLTIDAYRVDMTDRITQSADITLTAQQAQDMEDAGFSGASELRSFRFFINDFETTTQGIDVKANYTFELVGGHSSLNLAYNYNTTEVTDFNAMTLNELRIRQIEDSLPQHRGYLSWHHQRNAWETVLRANYFGSYWIAHVSNLNFAFEPSAEVTFDIALTYTFGSQRQYSMAIGAENVFDNYPDKNPFRKETGSEYPELGPMGIMGGLYYLRMRYDY